MKLGIVAFLVGVFLSFALPGWTESLPPSCGNAKVKFDVSAHNSSAPPKAPANGKAQIVFLEDENQPIGPFMDVTVRYGMDGAWVGANHGNSYFTLNIAPGKHHLCANWQSSLRRFERKTELTSLTAEPGQVYYVDASVKVASQYEVFFDLSLLNEDEGQHRLTLSKRADSRPQHKGQ